MQLVITHKEKVTTTSLLIAEKFGKRHDDVLKAIKNLECSDDFRARNFAGSSYKTAQNKLMPMFIITRDGFSMLVMSFTGSLAAKFKEEFINEFNRMEDVLRLGKAPVMLATYQQRILSEPTKGVPDEYWSVFDESHTIMLAVEAYIGSINKYDLVDGSIGTHWRKFREGKPWAVESKKYPHEYNDERGTRDCHCYHDSEITHFKRWLKKKYKIEHLPRYLTEKYKKERNVTMLDKVNEGLPRLLGAA